MTRYIAGRLLALIPVSLGISMIVFAMIHLVPGDAAIAIAGPMNTPETLAKIREELGLTAPLHLQYLRWLAKAVQGDLGNSISLGRPVLSEVLQRFRASLLLASASFALALPLGVGAGVAAALSRGSPLDKTVVGITVAGISMPPFYFGMLLIIVFSILLGWLPAGGMFDVTGDPTIGSVALHLILPSVALAGAPITVLARIVRASMLEVLTKDYVRTAHAKGLGAPRVIYRHALRNALVPVIGLMALQVGYLLSATALVEVVFSWPGIGSMMVQSITARDLPLVQGCVLVIAVVYVVVNTVGDLVQLVMDPRIRYG
jgi:peptide/nickel transport system permease protein